MPHTKYVKKVYTMEDDPVLQHVVETAKMMEKYGMREVGIAYLGEFLSHRYPGVDVMEVWNKK